ncbi:hypothetical protein [Desulfonema magnum]|uniref:Uncharacterized protein n=1 Tax=Desulfonema magnum TaxID=45655 RepID=A0A975GRY6_9BACT|nr:hypothetical protein [Desulfonema magnum]QTA91425.1 Uncharacterized protein dnm_074920 [Desulfonema magnum]
MKFLLPIFLLLCVTVAAESPKWNLTQTDRSASGKLVAEHYVNDSIFYTEIFIRPSKGNVKPVFLVGYDRSAAVSFSPDDKWIALNDHAGSNESHVRVFKRGQGVKFIEQKKVNITKEAWRFLALQHGRKHPPDFDHSYVYMGEEWLSSREILLALFGYSDSNGFRSVDPYWFCVYNVYTGKFAPAPGDMNRNSAVSFTDDP